MDASRDDLTRVEDTTREPVARAKRTYGRRKDTIDTPDDTTSTSRSSLRTRLSLIRDTRSASNSPVDASNYFGIADDLAAIDKQFDEEETDPMKGSRARETRSGDSSSTKSPSTEDDSNSAADESILSAMAPPLTSSQSEPPSPDPVSPIQGLLARQKRNDNDDNAEVSNKAVNNFKLPVMKTSRQVVIPPSSDPEQEDESDALPDASGDASTTRQRNVLEVSPVLENKSRRRSTVPKEPNNKIKKLSKKEENESRKIHARHMAEQKVAITKRTSKRTIRDFLLDIAKPHASGKGKLVAPVSSDPIQDFSSPSLVADPRSSSPNPDPPVPHDISDEEMFSIPDLLQPKSTEKRDSEVVEQRRKSLALAKQRAIERMENEEFQSDASDEDLELVIEEKGPRKNKRATDYEKRLANVAGFRPGKQSISDELDGSQGDRAIKLAAKSAFSDVNRRTSVALDHRDLQNMIRSKAIKQSKQLTREKEEEWESRGGRSLAKHRSGKLVIEDIAKHLIERTGGDDDNNGKPLIAESESDHNGSEEEDEDWHPEERGSASPKVRPARRAEREEEFDGELGSASEDETVQDENLRSAADTEELDNPNHRRRQPRSSIKRAIMLDSDEENENSQGRILVHETSLVLDDSSQSRGFESSEGEENKENDNRLAFENGEDKENIAVSPRGLVGSQSGIRQPSIFDLGSSASRFSMSPSPSPRRPLRAKKSDDDTFLVRSPPNVITFGSPKANWVLSSATSPGTLQPAFGEIDGGGFSQFFNDDEGVFPLSRGRTPKNPLKTTFMSPGDGALPLQSSFEPRPLKAANFSDEFLMGTQDAESLGRSKRPMTDSDISLTLDVKLQPALDVTTQQRREAESVFEKDQEDLVLVETSDSINSKRKNEKELYVNEIGMLTQTRPEDSTPLIYRTWTPSQKQAAFLGSQATVPPSTTRQPLSTLSFTTDETPLISRLSRLRKGKERGLLLLDDDNDDGIDVGPLSTNAFTKLLEAAKKKHKKEKRKLGKSEFVEGEAQESDEDELLGFGGGKKEEEDDSEDDDPNAVVENLVDDATMNAEQLAEDKVLEKVKEQLEEEDAALQKYHQAAVEGKYRTKRRGGGLAMSDSDSDFEDDDEARRLRRRMNKRRRIEGDTLEALAKNEKTRAFYDAYQRDVLEDDNEDFAHLEHDDMDMLEEDDENEPPETVSAADIRDQLREAARNNKGKEKLRIFNPEDVNWAESRTSDDEFDVKEVEDKPKQSTRRKPLFGQSEIPDFDETLPRKVSKLDDVQAAQLAAWRKEQSGRDLGTGGIRGAITVTGHGMKNSSNSNHNIRSSNNSVSSNGTRLMSARGGGDQHPLRRKVTKTASVLASVTSKQKQFER